MTIVLFVKMWEVMALTHEVLLPLFMPSTTLLSLLHACIRASKKLMFLIRFSNFLSNTLNANIQNLLKTKIMVICLHFRLYRKYRSACLFKQCSWAGAASPPPNYPTVSSASSLREKTGLNILNRCVPHKKTRKKTDLFFS